MNLFVDILFVVFVFAIVVQLFYAFYFFIRLSFYKEKSESFNQGVSVIICAKDEAEMLSANLPSFLDQDYSEYEVIVVDDQSVDGTKYLLKDLEKKYFNLKVVTIDPHVISRVGKKFALTLGIKTREYISKKSYKLCHFLIARLFYNDGLVTIFALGGIYAVETLDFTFDEVMILGIVLNISAA